MTDITEYIAELQREIKMRQQVYPGRVRTLKMSQATADKKTALMQNILMLFAAAQMFGVLPEHMHLSDITTLPFIEPDGNPFPISDLAPHIKECESEIAWRIHRLGGPMGKATRTHAERQLQLLKEILEILQRIQGLTRPVSQAQLSLF